MYIKIKRGRLKDLSAREQRFLQERRRYFADDVGRGVLLELNDEDATLQFFFSNSEVERFAECRPHKPLKEYIYT
jgi:hypothetical protein